MSTKVQERRRSRRCLQIRVMDLGAMSTFRVFIAFLLPPLAIVLLEGTSLRYGLCCALTACGLIPGVLYALVVLYRHEARPRPL